MRNKFSETRKKETLNTYSGLYTDMYELTMAQGYFLTGRKHETAVFDYFFRKNPFEGAFVVFAGLRDLLEVLEGLSFDTDEIDYLRLQGFKDEFLEYLKDFKFSQSKHIFIVVKAVKGYGEINITIIAK